MLRITIIPMDRINYKNNLIPIILNNLLIKVNIERNMRRRNVEIRKCVKANQNNNI
jgi:hypothetical protein